MEDNEKEWPYRETTPEAGTEEPSVESGASIEDAAGGEPGEAAALRNRIAYLSAEFDNYRKRAAREREVQAAYSNEQLMRSILPFLDNLERAMGQAGADPAVILDGIRMSYDLFLADLRKFGLEQASSEGKPFDPSIHEAIGAVAREGMPEGTVLSESRKGYLLNGRLLRPAQVLVAAPSGEDPDGQGS